MKDLYLVVIDTSQIQPYIFGSNRLRENVGASYLVDQSTGQWALQMIGELAQHSNVKSYPNEVWGLKTDQRQIENTDANALDIEVIYAAGGNVMALFANQDIAKTFVRQLSRKGITEARGLQLVAALHPFDWENGEGTLKKAQKAAFDQLGEKKRTRSAPAPVLGLGVTYMCESTGLPAAGLTPKIQQDKDTQYPASAEILAKHEAIAGAKARMRSQFGDVLGHANGPFDFPLDFDEMGRSLYENSHIAIVHADGNGMGALIQSLGDNITNNRKYIHVMRQFSQAISDASLQAVRNTLDQLCRKVDAGEIVDKRKDAHGHFHEIARIKLQENGVGWFLPFRPLVFGGDDITFVCDGRLGLPLAVILLKQFSACLKAEMTKTFDQDDKVQALIQATGEFDACAGVAIVKTHYPFARAYALAEDLCDNAKKKRAKEGQKGSYLDWHLAYSGLSGDIGEMRKREYTFKRKEANGDEVDMLLTLRPVALAGDDYRTWSVVANGLDGFYGPEWLGRRNKIKALCEVLREGDIGVESFRKRFNKNAELPAICPSVSKFQETGWYSNTCGYFDALELIDMYVPLEDKAV